MVLKRLIFFAFLLLLVPKESNSQSSSSNPDIAQLLMTKVVEGYKNENTARSKFGFTRTEVIEYYDSAWRLKSTRVETKVVSTGQKEPGNLNIDIAGILVDKSQFYIDDQSSTKVISGINCIAIGFKPKPNLQTKTTSDQILSKVEGVIYINLDDFSMVRAEASAQKQFGFTHWFYILPIWINVSRLEMEIEFTRLEDITVRKSVTATVDATGYSKQKHTFTYNNYRQ